MGKSATGLTKGLKSLNIDDIETASKSRKLTAPPKQAAPPTAPAPAPADRKALEDARKQVREDEMVEVRRKVESYLRHPKFQELLRGVAAPKSSASDVEWRSALEQIYTTMKAAYKDMMVTMMFEQGCTVAETVMVEFLKMEDKRGLAPSMVAHRGDFEPELSEIAIELANNWVPGPHVRLLGKVARYMMAYRGTTAKDKLEVPASPDDDSSNGSPQGPPPFRFNMPHLVPDPE